MPKTKLTHPPTGHGPTPPPPPQSSRTTLKQRSAPDAGGGGAGGGRGERQRLPPLGVEEGVAHGLRDGQVRRLLDAGALWACVAWQDAGQDVLMPVLEAAVRQEGNDFSLYYYAGRGGGG